jgi:type 9 secretion system plug protein
MNLMKGCFIIVLFSIITTGNAQQGELYFRDHIYVPNIRSVQLSLLGLPNSLPIYVMGKPAALVLTFDDMDANFKFYTYHLVHCDMFWNPSNLLFHEYATGFDNEEITEYASSITTRIPFANYRLTLPNANTQITKSGNYMLIVHEFGDSRPILSRRFVVLEPPVITMRMIKVRPSNVSRINTHQEIRFDIDTKELLVRDPKTEIMAVMLQNGRWDNAIINLISRYEKGSLLVFDYIDKIVFPAGKEFRSVDIRSTEYRGEGVFSLERVDGYIRSIGRLDKERATEPYFSRVDINGKFLISSQDYPNPEDYDLRSDYVEHIFTLQTGRKYIEDVYVFGELTDWELKDEFRMQYDAEYSSYTTAAWLKQGYYDYIYVLGNADGTADETTIEGNWFESTNDYTLIVYYRPFGARYDRAIGASSFEWGR